jgi:hypothetical protein
MATGVGDAGGVAVGCAVLEASGTGVEAGVGEAGLLQASTVAISMSSRIRMTAALRPCDLDIPLDMQVPGGLLRITSSLTYAMSLLLK